MINFIDTERSFTMKRIVITLIATLGFSGAVFADTIDLRTQNAGGKFSSVEATSYIASLSEQGAYQVFNP
jgi:hypothetical protein